MGAVVKLAKVANGNDFEDCESLDNAINRHLNLFSSTSHLSQFSQENQENEGPMRRSCPPGPQSRKRLKSRNEMTVTKMRDSNKRRSQCGFCLVVGHHMTCCQALKDLNAQVLGGKRDTTDQFMSGLGNPTVHKVEKPGAEEKQLLQEWMTSASLIPKQTKHIHIVRCFHSATEVASHSQNVLEVKLLHVQGGEWPA